MKENITVNSGVEAYAKTEYVAQLKQEFVFSTEKGDLEYSLITPEQCTSEVPLVYIGGFALEKDAYARELFNVVESGQQVMFTNPTKGFELDALVSVEEVIDLPESVLRKVAALCEFIDHHQLKQIDLVGHSQGGIVATALATQRPGLIRNLILESPEGFQGNMSKTALATIFTYEALREGWEAGRRLVTHGDVAFVAATLKTLQSFIKGASKDTLWRFMTEISDSASVDLAPLLKQIKENNADLDNKTKVVLINANNDNLFTPIMYEEGIEFDEGTRQIEDGEGPFRYVDMWIMYSDKQSGHNAASVEEPGLLAQIIAAS